MCLRFQLTGKLFFRGVVMGTCVMVLAATLAISATGQSALGGAQTIFPEDDDVPMHVDGEGVMRWTETGLEVALFGVNYATPFAFGFRAHGYVGADRKRAMDADVAHMARLGLDAFRVHMWDRQITDKGGNLIQNDHLDLLDYLLAKLAEHNIRSILTPIAWWPPGYPEPAAADGGISDFYSKGEMTTSPEALSAQVNYLRQFIAHVNPYTGYSYGSDPSIIAVELFNEPDHPGTSAQTTRFITTLAQTLRAAGYAKPIFYNISQGYSDDHGHAVCAAEIQGVAGQWYPAGLVRGNAIGGNMLPNVDRYTIPWDAFPECKGKARMVYEFDAADVAGAYMYPAMARSFRGAGFQWATQFAYDALAIAHTNSDYQTHFLNLVYTPSKAISFMIAGEVFRQTERGSVFGVYPESGQFGPFRVSYEENLSEMAADTAFFYSGSTTTTPPNAQALRHVAGTGASSVIRYDGSGSYFLDRIEPGAWRLEVYPDVVQVEDPFSRPSMSRQAVHVLWQDRVMAIDLPDLGMSFGILPVNDGNKHAPAVRDGMFTVRPGIYVLARQRDSVDAAALNLRASGRDKFYAPPTSLQSTVVLHEAPSEIPAGTPFEIRADVVSRQPVDSVAVFFRRVGRGRPMTLPMKRVSGSGFAVIVPASALRPGLAEYAIVVYQGSGAKTFPGASPGHPYQWDFTGGPFWTSMLVAPGSPLVLFDARRDQDLILYPHQWGYVPFRTDLDAGSEADRLSLSATVLDLTPAPHNLTLRANLQSQVALRTGPFDGQDVLVIRARSATENAGRLEMALVQRDGTAWATELTLTTAWEDFVVPVSQLKRTSLALLPRPYPQFLPDRIWAATTASGPDIQQLDGVQFALLARQFPGSETVPHGFQVERVTLRRRRMACATC
ncbi:MAG: hypothetical protein ACI80V_003423 [Rhodothermales bacterium]|jgi:hypothetical protein